MQPAMAVAYTGPRFAVTGVASIRAAQPFDPAPAVTDEGMRTLVAVEDVQPLIYPDSSGDAITFTS